MIVYNAGRYELGRVVDDNVGWRLRSDVLQFVDTVIRVHLVYTCMNIYIQM